MSSGKRWSFVRFCFPYTTAIIDSSFINKQRQLVFYYTFKKPDNFKDLLLYTYITYFQINIRVFIIFQWFEINSNC